MLLGKSGKEDYDKFPHYRATADAESKCIMMATAYTETMLTRAKLEDPEIFAVKGMSKSEMQTHLVHNMCLPYKKLNASVFRNTTASIKEKRYLQEDIRRLSNGGQKFHPYI